MPVSEKKRKEADQNGAISLAPDINDRMSLLELYLSELDHLSGADSSERSEIYEKAARLGTKLIEGQL